MAKNVTIAGASYSDVPAIVVPKSGGGTATFVDPVEIIDDTAGSGDTDKVWSADKSASENSSLLSAIGDKYEKPSGGIPGTDLADTYIEEPSSDGTNGQVLTTDGNGGRSWTTVQGGGSSDVGVESTNAEDVDLDIADENGYVALRLKDGHVQTKFFDSKKSTTLATNASNVDLDVTDDNGYVLLRMKDGELETKGFSSASIKSRMSTAETNINNISDAIGTGYAVPDYWVSTLESKEATINGLNNGIGANGVTFLFFTDYHQNTNNGKSLPLMLHVLGHTSVSDVFYGGDTSDGGSLANTAAAEAKLREVVNYLRPLHMYSCRGNHDCEPSATVTTNQVPEASYYDMFVRPVEKDIHGTGKPYFYIDNDTAKVRYIFMDSGSTITQALDSTQITWFKGRLTELTTGWTVVIFQHIVYEKVNTEQQTIVTAGTTLMNAIGDVYNGLNCTIAAVIAGHCHTDAIISTNYNFKVITTTCDSAGANAAVDPLYPTRTAGTTSEQAFDVFTIDTANQTINMTRIGAGIDRSTTY